MLIEVLTIIAVALIGLLVIAELVAIAGVFWGLNVLVNKARDYVWPIAIRTGDYITKADKWLKRMEPQVEKYAARAEQVTEKTAAQVDKTTRQTQRAVAFPVIAASSVAEGLRRGLAVWAAARRGRRPRVKPRQVMLGPDQSVVITPEEVENVTYLRTGEAVTIVPEDVEERYMRKAA